MKNFEFNKLFNKSSKSQELISKLYYNKQKPIILCLGDEKTIADCLGPLVGHLLVNKYNLNTSIYGKLGRNVTNYNIDMYYRKIKKHHKNAPIILIDASVNSLEYMGNIKISESYTECFKNTKKIKCLADVYITGVVLPKGMHCKFLLKQTKLSFVYNLAHQIAKIVKETYDILY